ncbi:MAG: mucoidy inhibitor MuiA family protein [Spirochaetales bacterium]|nr:mucoidy inhibitor MuiA family protein [Leptospiraceae bacterium]MCP5481832.1 mucoidy inhibitor MuiA family protein [Spirochaetales bacterium]
MVKTLYAPRSTALATAFGLVLAFQDAGHAQSAPETPRFLAPIREALVYPDRALVTRITTVRLPVGRHILTFAGAPASLDGDSLRASSGNDALSVAGVRRRIERRVASDNDQVRGLQEQVRTLEHRRDGEKARAARGRVELANIDRYSNFLSAMISRQAPAAGEDPSRWQAAYRSLSERRVRTQAEVQHAEESQRRIEDEIEILKGSLDRIISAANQSYSVIEVTVNSLANADSELRVSYVVPNASWSVAYNAELKSDGRLGLEYMGVVRQETGEDWTDVELSLSTAVPSRGAERPALRSLRVSARESATQTRFEVVEAERGEGAAETNVTNTAQQTGGATELERSGESVIFRVPRRVSIASSADSSRVPIARFDEEPREVYLHLAGAMQRTPALAVRARNSRSFPLLAGPADAFRNSGFVGRTSMPYASAGAEFVVGLGADLSVRNERTVTNRRESAGTLSSDNYFYTRIEYQLRNTGDRSQKIELFDRIPVSDVASVQVERLNDTTAGAEEVVANSGILRWKLELRPGERRTVILHYRVRAPSSFPGTIYGQ